jgi:hypothetical protein
MAKMRKRRPSANVSETKSSDQRWRHASRCPRSEGTPATAALADDKPFLPVDAEELLGTRGTIVGRLVGSPGLYYKSLRRLERLRAKCMSNTYYYHARATLLQIDSELRYPWRRIMKSDPEGKIDDLFENTRKG